MFQYRVKVRGTSYLWGGAAIYRLPDSKAILAIRVDELGESIAISTRAPSSTKDNLTLLGELAPGEALSIDLANLGGVAAVVKGNDTMVECMILHSPS